MGCLILVGMMGSGKTSVGRILSSRLGLPFRDTDKMIQDILGRPVHQLFKHYGEDTFRQHETRLLQDLEVSDCVLSTGGGTVIKDENWAELKRLGKTVFLDVDIEVLKERLKTAKKIRPLIEAPGWEDRLDQIIQDRRPMYERADIVIRLKNEGHEQVADMVIQAIGK